MVDLLSRINWSEAAPILFFIGWVLLMGVVLPKLGVRT
jgi:hypothetical protein